MTAPIAALFAKCSLSSLLVVTEDASFSLIHNHTCSLYNCLFYHSLRRLGYSHLIYDVYISEDGPGQETFTDEEESALPPDLKWLDELYE